jgi:NAD(P)-dependent dehydrogenase (short-subunit alcohol dehydrogenase family)
LKYPAAVAFDLPRYFPECPHRTDHTQQPYAYVRATSRSVLVSKSDPTIDSEIVELARRLKHEFGILDVLVHCAGAFTTGQIEATPVEHFDATRSRKSWL